MKRNLPFAWLLRWIAVLGLVGWSTPSQAACLALAGCSCNASTSTLSFGNYNPLSGSATTSVTTMQVGCGGVAGLLIPYKIDLSTGGGTYATRRMSSGANKLSYNLYTDNTYLTVWGDGTNSTHSVSGNITLDVLGSSQSRTISIYGRIPASQTTAVPGSYTDTITVTVTFY